MTIEDQAPLQAVYPSMDKVYIALQQEDPETILQSLFNFGSDLVKKFSEEDITRFNQPQIRGLYLLNKQAKIRLAAIGSILQSYLSDKNQQNAQGKLSHKEYKMLEKTCNLWNKAIIIFTHLIIDRNHDLYHVSDEKTVDRKISQWSAQITKKADLLIKNATTDIDFDKKHTHDEKKDIKHPALKEKMLQKINDKINNIRRRGGQYEKLAALWEVHAQFEDLDLHDEMSIKSCLEVINKNLKFFEGFSSAWGKFGAWIKQSFFETGYSDTVSDTRLLMGELIEFIHTNALPLAKNYDFLDRINPTKPQK